MTDEGPPPTKRVKWSRDQLQDMTKEELMNKYLEQEAYLESVVVEGGEEGTKTKESSRRENVLVMRLTTKEQEMQDYITQVQELKQAQNPSTAQLRSMLLDPAINLMFQRMKKEMDLCREKQEQAQNDLAAWKFTPDSQTGKRLMARCRMLLQENEELGKVISSGRTAKLESEIALEKTLVQEMKKSQAEMDEFLGELDDDVEGMQSTIYLLQQQLKEVKEQLAQAIKDNQALRMASAAPNTDSGPTGHLPTDSHPPTHTDTLRQPRTDHVVSNHTSPQTVVTTNGGHDVEMDHCGRQQVANNSHTQTNHRHENRELSSKSNRAHGRTDIKGSTEASPQQDSSPQHSRHSASVKVKIEVDDKALGCEPERTNKCGPWANETLQNGIEDTSQSDSALEDEISEHTVGKMEA